MGLRRGKKLEILNKTEKYACSQPVDAELVFEEKQSKSPTFSYYRLTKDVEKNSGKEFSLISALQNLSPIAPPPLN